MVSVRTGLLSQISLQNWHKECSEISAREALKRYQGRPVVGDVKAEP
jgi:hypothetical protein